MPGEAVDSTVRKHEGKGVQAMCCRVIAWEEIISQKHGSWGGSLHSQAGTSGWDMFCFGKHLAKLSKSGCSYLGSNGLWTGPRVYVTTYRKNRKKWTWFEVFLKTHSPACTEFRNGNATSKCSRNLLYNVFLGFTLDFLYQNLWRVGSGICTFSTLHWCSCHQLKKKKKDKRESLEVRKHV